MTSTPARRALSPRVRAVLTDLIRPADGAARRVQAGRLSALLYLVGVGYVLLMVPTQPPGRVRVVLLVAAGVALAAAAVQPLLPWHQLPDWTTVLPTVLALALMSVAGGMLAGVLQEFTVLYPLSFLYLGLTQRPGTPTALVPVALGGVGLGVLGQERLRDAVVLTLAVLVSAGIGELLALAVHWQRRARRQVQELLAALATLVRAEDELSATTQVAELARSLLAADATIVLLADPTRPRLFRGHGSAGSVGPAAGVVLDLDRGPTGVARAVDTGATVFVADAPRSPGLRQDFVASFRVASLAHIPIRVGDQPPFGVITAIWRRHKPRLDSFDEQVMQLLSAEAGPTIERLRRLRSLETAARTDPLTELGNRRALLDALAGLPVGGVVVFCDLDGFKAVNDQLGHAAGDQVLVTFAGVLRRMCRAEDLAFRYGGDEFVVLLRRPGEAGARRFTQRLLTEWAEQAQPTGVSVGYAARDAGEDAAVTLRLADAAAYEHKRATDRLPSVHRPAAEH